MASTEGRRFSFNKKPISGQRSRPSRISIVHDYPPQQCDHVDHDSDHSKFYSKYRGILKNKDELPDDLIDDLSFEYDYDEKIRAPRMSVVTMFKSKPSPRGSVGSSASGCSGTSSRNSELSEEHAGHADGDATGDATGAHAKDRVDNLGQRHHQYYPAKFDLSQPTRRSSGAETIEFRKDPYTFQKRLDTTGSYASSNISPGAPMSSNEPLSANGADASAATRESSSSPISSRRSSMVSRLGPPQPGMPKRNSSPKSLRNVASMSHLKQINEPARVPNNYVPTALRPIEKDDLVIPELTPMSPSIGSESASKASSKEESSRDESSKASSRSPPRPHIQHVDTTVSNNSTSTVSLFKKANKLEPTHSLWKPNSSANHCAGCGKEFHLLRRRHHCRHCGSIFCRDCLSRSANLNILAKFENPCPRHHQMDGLSTQLLTATTSAPGNQQATSNPRDHSCLETVLSNGSTNSTCVDYSKYSKVCEQCYHEWLQFLETGVDYETSYKNLDELEVPKDHQGHPAQGGSGQRRSTVAVSNDWVWSSF